MVDLLEADPLEIELAATLLYQFSHHSYRQIRDVVSAMPAQQRQEIVDIGLRHRGRHDEISRAFCSGQQFRFDILMDIGGFRDMHRHGAACRSCRTTRWLTGTRCRRKIASAGLAER